MMKNEKLFVALIASAVATLGSGSVALARTQVPTPKAPPAGQSKSAGTEHASMVCVNADCHGNAELAGSNWDGKGKNVCSGYGLLKASTDEECAAKKGKWQAAAQVEKK